MLNTNSHYVRLVYERVINFNTYKVTVCACMTSVLTFIHQSVIRINEMTNSEITYANNIYSTSIIKARY